MEILTGLIPDCNYMHDLYYLSGIACNKQHKVQI